MFEKCALNQSGASRNQNNKTKKNKKNTQPMEIYIHFSTEGAVDETLAMDIEILYEYYMNHVLYTQDECANFWHR
jgi:hypothetical protein